MKYIVVIFLGITNVILAQSRDVNSIFELQDSRAKPISFLPYLKSSDPMIVKQAVLAFGSTQDDGAIRFLIPLLSHEDDEIRSAVAFSMGQIKDSLAMQPLINQWKIEKNSLNRIEFARAVGRSIMASQVSGLTVQFSEQWPAKHERAEFIMRLGIQAITNTLVIDIAFNLLRENEDEILYKTMYGLNRMRLNDNQKRTLTPLVKNHLQHPSVNTRMIAVQLMGKLSPNDMGKELVDYLEKETDATVKVSLIQLIGVSGYSVEKLQSLLRRINDQTPYVQSATATTISSWISRISENSSRSDSILNLIKLRLDTAPDPLQKQDIDWLVLGVKIHPDWDSGFISELRLHNNPVLRSYYTQIPELKGNMSSLIELQDLIKSPFQPVRTASVGGWLKVFKKLNRSKEEAKQVILPLFEAGDMAQITAIAEALSDSTFQFPGFELAMEATLNKMDPVEDIEAVQEILKTFGKISSLRADSILIAWLDSRQFAISSVAWQGLLAKNKTANLAPPILSAIPERLNHNWQTIQPLWGGRRAFIKTTAGEFAIELLTSKTPFTVLTFYELAESGFYKNLYFHRVVPNFVVQGGDPRGDGWGGPGYMIRSEFSQTLYESAGYVGIASAGKDTEGCQFFITHSPTPHLDGRYTIFGRIVFGMETTQRLQIGDQILSVEIR